jgi:hypothetical protein
MDLVGGLLYKFSAGSVHYFSYVVASARLFDVDIIDLIEDMLGNVPPLLSRIQACLQGSLVSIVDNIVFGKADSVLALIPETIDANTPIARLSWLQGGSPQYWICPSNMVLAGVSSNPVITTAVIPGLTSLEIFGLSVVTAWYKPALEPSDYYVPNPDYYDFVVSVSGNYYYHFPRGSYLVDKGTSNELTVSRRSFYSPYSSHLYCRYLSVFQPLDPPLPGSYYHADSVLQWNDGVSTAEGIVEPFLSDSGIDYSSPFTPEIPSDSALQGAVLVRLWRSLDAVVNADNLGGGGSFWSFGGVYITITPKLQPEPPLKAIIASRGVPLSVLLGYRLLMRQLERN